MRKVCKTCGKLLRHRRPNARYCSPGCKYSAWYVKNRRAHIANQARRRRRRVRKLGVEAIRAEWRRHQRARRKRLAAAAA